MSSDAPICSLTTVSLALVAPDAKEAVTVTSAGDPSGKGAPASVVNLTRPLGGGGWKPTQCLREKEKSARAPNSALPGAVPPSRVKNTFVSSSERP